MKRLPYPKRIQYNLFIDCLERTKKKVDLDGTLVHFMLSTSSIVADDNRNFRKTANAIQLINERLCPGQWCTRTHCKEYSSQSAYYCKSTRPNVCEIYKKYIEKKEQKK